MFSRLEKSYYGSAVGGNHRVRLEAVSRLNEEVQDWLKGGFWLCGIYRVLLCEEIGMERD